MDLRVGDQNVTEQRTSDQVLYTCPDCRCRFVQPFKCTTCGAEKLYDETVRQQARTIEHLRSTMGKFDDFLTARLPDGTSWWSRTPVEVLHEWIEARKTIEPRAT